MMLEYYDNENQSTKSIIMKSPICKTYIQQIPLGIDEILYTESDVFDRN